MTAFVHLHLHTDASLFDGFGTAAMFAVRARELGMTAMAVTDHGTMGGIYDVSVAFESAGIRPIYGCEMYVADDVLRKGLTEDEREIALIGCKTKDERKKALKAEEHKLGVGKSFHAVVLALNEVGFANLCRITSWAWMHGLYKKPRIDLSVLAQHHEGLFVTSACRGGIVGQAALNGDFATAVARARAFKALLGRRFALEVQPHHVQAQYDLNRICERMGKALDIPLIACGDAHYPNKADREAHEVAVCIGRKDMMTNPAHFKFDEGGIYHVASEREMLNGLLESLSPEAVVQAMSVAALVGQAAQPIAFKLKAAMPFSAEASEVLRKDAYKGLWRIGKQGDKQYVDQVEHELRVLDAQHFAGYFVMVADVINAARTKGILVGPGRGSAAGSLVAYLVGITAIDPIVHKLSFSRFIPSDGSEARASGLPDIDTDIPRGRRQEVVEYIREKYGDGRVCQIGTTAKQKRSGLKDVARVMGVPFDAVNVVAGIIEPKKEAYDQAQEEDDDEEEEPIGAIRAALMESDVGRQFDNLYPDVADYAERLLGQRRSAGIHAAGVVISSVPLDSVVPLETRVMKKGKERVVVSALDMHGIEARGLVKLDVLGLKTLDVLSGAAGAVLDASPELSSMTDVDEFLRTIPLDDKETLDAFTAGRFAGVFQFDTQGAREFCRGIEFRTFDDIVTVISLNRPGPKNSGLAEVWKRRHAGGEEVPQVHPLYDEVVASTLGVLTFQEQVLEFLRRIGYTPPEADKVRKSIGKKTGFDVEKESGHFIPAAVERGLDAEFARQLLESIVLFGGYAFNKNHAAPYALISYWCMYLRVHFPNAFYLAALDVEEKQDAVRRLVGEARAVGIVIRGPDVNASGKGFTAAVGGSIVCSLSSIKGVGDRAAYEVAAHRPYTSFVDVLERVDRRTVNRKVVSLLVRAGALDTLLPSAKWALERWSDLSPMFEKKRFAELKTRIASADRSVLDVETEIERALRMNEVCPLAPQVQPGKLLCDWIEEFTREGLGWCTFSQVRSRGHGIVPCSVVEHKGKGGSVRLALSDVDGEESAVRFQMGAPGVNRVLAGTGQVVLAGISVQRRGFMSGNYLIDLPALVEKLKLGGELDTWEDLVVHHPLRGRVKKSWTDGGGARRRPAIVLTRKEIRDRHHQLMAFIGIEGGFGEMVEMPVFSRAYTAMVKRALKPGNLVLLTTRALDEGGATIIDAEKVKA